MTTAESTFIIATSIALLILFFLVKKIDWQKIGFKPKHIFYGWLPILFYNAIIFTLIQLTVANKLIVLPYWMLDEDPLLPLIAICFLQEILFRGLAISWLERFGRQKALWISILIFVMFHLVAPYSWSSAGLIFAGLTLVGGYFWGWHFLKFRNIYLLAISHFLVNLSFNYIILKLIF